MMDKESIKKIIIDIIDKNIVGNTYRGMEYFILGFPKDYYDIQTDITEEDLSENHLSIDDLKNIINEKICTEEILFNYNLFFKLNKEKNTKYLILQINNKIINKNMLYEFINKKSSVILTNLRQSIFNYNKYDISDSFLYFYDESDFDNSKIESIIKENTKRIFNSMDYKLSIKIESLYLCQFKCTINIKIKIIDNKSYILNCILNHITNLLSPELNLLYIKCTIPITRKIIEDVNITKQDIYNEISKYVYTGVDYLASYDEEGFLEVEIYKR